MILAEAVPYVYFVSSVRLSDKDHIPSDQTEVLQPGTTLLLLVQLAVLLVSFVPC